MITYCTSVRNRWDHLLKTIPLTLANLAPCDRWVILDYGSETIPVNSATALIQGDSRVFLYRQAATEWRVGHAKNVAHSLGLFHRNHNRILCNLDADNWIAQHYSPFLDSRVTTRTLLIGSPVLADAPRKGFIRGAEGRVAMTIDNFYGLGGYDERMGAWGCDVTDLIARARLAGLEVIAHVVNQFIPHDNTLRGLASQSKKNVAAFLDNLRTRSICPNGTMWGKHEAIRLL